MEGPQLFCKNTRPHEELHELIVSKVSHLPPPQVVQRLQNVFSLTGLCWRLVRSLCACS